jgi:hypothetical protein
MIDPTSGRMYTVSVVGLALPGPLPLVVSRSYSTHSLEVDVGLGPGWSHSLAWIVDPRRRSVVIHEPGAAPTKGALPRVGGSTRLPCGLLTRFAWGFTLDRGGIVRVFAQRAGSHWMLTRIVDANGNAVALDVREGLLRNIVDSAGRLVRVRRDAEGRILAFEVQNVEASRWQSFRTYYYDGRILRWRATARVTRRDTPDDAYE